MVGESFHFLWLDYAGNNVKLYCKVLSHIGHFLFLSEILVPFKMDV